MELADSRESMDWQAAHTDTDLLRQLDSSAWCREFLDLASDISPDDWVTIDVCEPKEGQLIYLMMGNWDKPSSGTYGNKQVHLYGDRYVAVPRNPKEFYWKPCILPPGLPRRRDPLASPPARRPDVVDRDTRGNREPPARHTYTAPMDHRYPRDDDSDGNKPGRDRAHRRDNLHRDKNRSSR